MPLREIAQLAKWLGPWAESSRAPDAIALETSIAARKAGERPIPVVHYRPRKGEPRGAVLLVQGLHFAGPYDPRLDRFARILASSGKQVLAPHLPDFHRMVLAPSLLSDTERCLADLLERTAAERAGVMSISFGSLPALALASTSRWSSRVSSVVTFGGYGDFAKTLSFCLEGGHGLPHDPLNRPALFLNLIGYLPAVRDPDPLCETWREYMRRTWGQPEMKDLSRHGPVATALAARVCDADRELFLQGCGVAPGGVELARAAIAGAAATGHFDWLDPQPHLRELRVPLTVVHGRDDDVIPYTQAEPLAQAAPNAVHRVTGMYSHTGSTGIAGGLRRIPEMAAELRTMVDILRALGDLGRS